jgi:hypothetical protein
MSFSNLGDDDYADAFNALDPGGDHTHIKFKYAGPICNLFLQHQNARTSCELDFLAHHFSVYTNMKWLQEQVGNFRGVDVDDLRISVTSSGGFAADYTVALVVKKGTQSWMFLREERKVRRQRLGRHSLMRLGERVPGQ